MKGCQICKEQKGPHPKWKHVETTCFKCGKRVTRILDLHHTNAHLCSLQCEKDYWLDIVY